MKYFKERNSGLAVSIWLLLLSSFGFAQALIPASDTIDPFPPSGVFDQNQEDQSLEEAKFHRIVLSVLASYQGLAQYHNAHIQLRMPLNAPIPEGCEFPQTDEEILHCSWESGFPNADAGRGLRDSIWMLGVGGGLLGLKGMTEEGLSLVVCHEIGHLFGGFPFMREGFTGLAIPISTDGQADYFAVQVCLRRLWSHQDNSKQSSGKRYRELIEKTAAEHCDEAYSDASSRNLCDKSIYAGMSFVKALMDPSESRIMPSIDTPDLSIVESTLSTHPDAQCRFDSFVAAALCPTQLSGFPLRSAESAAHSVWVDETLIPGFLQNHPGGPEARAESMAMSCREDFLPKGARPRCWFKPEQLLDGGWIDNL